MIISGDSDSPLTTAVEILDEYGTVYNKEFKNPKIAFQTANKIIAMYERDEDLDYSELESMGFTQMN